VLWILAPLHYLAKPGRSAPYSWYSYGALEAVVVTFIYATFLVQRFGIGDRVGSIVADE
jgi:hypothetical protein